MPKMFADTTFRSSKTVKVPGEADSLSNQSYHEDNEDSLSQRFRARNLWKKLSNKDDLIMTSSSWFDDFSLKSVLDSIH